MMLVEVGGPLFTVGTVLLCSEPARCGLSAAQYEFCPPSEEYRFLLPAIGEKDRVCLLSRNGSDWNKRYH
jgi:hypothetical protein